MWTESALICISQTNTKTQDLRLPKWCCEIPLKMFSYCLYPFSILHKPSGRRGETEANRALPMETTGIPPLQQKTGDRYSLQIPTALELNPGKLEELLKSKYLCSQGLPFPSLLSGLFPMLTCHRSAVSITGQEIHFPDGWQLSTILLCFALCTHPAFILFLSCPVHRA